MRPLHISRLCGLPAPLLLDHRPTAIGRCYVADRASARLVGLLGTGGLADDEALLLPRCRSVHAWGMATTIDCLFLDGRGEVILRRVLKPGRIVSCREAAAALECRRDGLPGALPGARLTLAAP